MSLKIKPGVELKVLKTNSGETDNGPWQYFIAADEKGRNKQTFFVVEPIPGLKPDDILVVDEITEVTFKQRKGNDGTWRPDASVNIKAHSTGVSAAEFTETDDSGELPF